MDYLDIGYVFILSFVKFMFAPIVGVETELPYWITYFSVVAGGICSAIVFYFSANFFMQRAAAKRRRKMEEAIKSGNPLKPKKKFTRMNKFVVRIKRSLGQWGVCIITPLILSVPVGSIICAKFYGKSKKSFPIIIFGMFLNAIITTSLSYWILGE
jgi:hypothetical protein